MKYQNNEKKIMIMAEVKKDPVKKFFVLIITGKKKYNVESLIKISVNFGFQGTILPEI